MKKRLILASLLTSSAAMANTSSVTIYGLVDLGLTHYSSAAQAGGGESSLVRVDSGIAQGSRLGFRGNEDLGGGLSAFFTLENGFNADDGSLGQGGLFFGRQAFVGLRSEGVGAISLGRQYDFMTSLGFYAQGQLSAAGALAWGIHADSARGMALSDHIWSGERTNNSVKFTSANLSGFTFGAMYGFGEVAGNSSAGRTVSAMAGYASGAFSSSLAYTDIKNVAGTASTRIYGAGATYALGALKPFGNATQVKNSGTGAKATTFELGALYSVSPQWDLSLGAQFQDRNQNVGSVKALVAVVDYNLSKRTDIYTGVVTARDKGANAFPVGGGGVQSGSGSQTAVRVGLRHRF